MKVIFFSPYANNKTQSGILESLLDQSGGIDINKPEETKIVDGREHDIEYQLIDNTKNSPRPDGDLVVCYMAPWWNITDDEKSYSDAFKQTFSSSIGESVSTSPQKLVFVVRSSSDEDRQKFDDEIKALREGLLNIPNLSVLDPIYVTSDQVVGEIRTVITQYIREKNNEKTVNPDDPDVNLLCQTPTGGQQSSLSDQTAVDDAGPSYQTTPTDKPKGSYSYKTKGGAGVLFGGAGFATAALLTEGVLFTGFAIAAGVMGGVGVVILLVAAAYLLQNRQQPSFAGDIAYDEDSGMANTTTNTK